MNDWPTATVCLVLGFVVTSYYYRVIHRRNYKMSPIAYKGEQWFRTPNRLRFPMWIAGGFFVASGLELVSLSLGFKLSDYELLRDFFFPIIPTLLASLLLEKNFFHLSDQKRTYPTFFALLILGAALALRVCSYS